MSNKNLTIPEDLAAANLAIENGITNEQIRPRLEEFGYTIVKMEVGRGLYQKAVAATVTQTSEHGEQHSATDDKNTAWEEADRVYMSDLKLGRQVIKDRGDRDRLLMDGERKQDYVGRKAQADQFYKIALEDAGIQAKLLEFNLTVVKLQAHQALINAAEEARLAKVNEKAEAENSTNVRNAALAELREWLSKYFTAAQIALQDQPQLLEALGIVVPSTPGGNPPDGNPPAEPPTPPTPPTP